MSVRFASPLSVATISTPSISQMNLAKHHVPGSKNTYYIPDFVTTDEEAFLLRKVSWQNHSRPSLRIHQIHADSGDTSAEMEATFESEVCYTMNFWVSTNMYYTTGCRHGVTRKSPSPADNTQISHDGPRRW